MEKNQIDERNNQKTSKIFGASSLQIGEDDASRLVGSIVEKGISENIPLNRPFSATLPLKPTVLPFPVARHRSHGPHWNPLNSKAGGGYEVKDKEDDDDEEDEFMYANPVAAFAKPIQRKEKKGLHFSKLTELIHEENSSATKKKEKSNLASKRVVKERVYGEATINSEKKMPSDPSFTSGDAEIPMEMDSEQHSTLNDTGKTIASRVGFSTTADMELDLLDKASNTKNGNLNGNLQLRFTENEATVEEVSRNNAAKARQQYFPVSASKSAKSSRLDSSSVSSSLEGDIDAENRARLEKMSPEELAEAQAEVIEKMNPALLNILKRRGQDKLKKQKPLGTDTFTAKKAIENIKGENQPDSLDIYPQQNHNIQTKVTSASTDSEIKENRITPDVGSGRGRLWDAWTERVEAVRNLRFSLDGSVVEHTSLSTTETGNEWSNVNNAAERDFLRTEGDPGAAGYTIKEALALARSAVPSQRSLALHLLASVLDNTLRSISHNQVGCTMRDFDKATKSTDWEAVWAYALGPEPELVLVLRMAIDDNHHSVVLACAKAIQAVLSCDLNEKFSDISEKTIFHGKDMFTAPVFRSKPEIGFGFLHGGFWKYNAKPSNIIASYEEVMDDEAEDKRTIQDDIFFAGQDFTAGLVRMEILPRIYYLLETEPTAALEESVMSILIAIARHSPTCAKAILKCPKLVQTVVKRFSSNNSMEVRPSQIKSVCLLKVLARFDKQICLDFINNGTFQAVTWHMCQYTSLDSWVNSGKDNCRLSSALLVEQLRLWKICIQNGFCISLFTELFPALCLWLSQPTLEKLMAKDLLSEFANVSREVYLVLFALAGTLPGIHSQHKLRNQTQYSTSNDLEVWCWNDVGPLIDLALEWVSSTSTLFNWKSGLEKDSEPITSLLWVYSAVMQMISRILEKVIGDREREHLPWFPEFVPKIGLCLVKSGLLSLSAANAKKYGKDSLGCSSFIEALCCLRLQSENESSLAAVSCLHVSTQVLVQKLIQSAKYGPSSHNSSSREESILANGLLTESLAELRGARNIFMDLVTSEWQSYQSIDMFGRGGPAPGVGFGWGAFGGGYWSTRVLLAQNDAGFLSNLLSIFQTVSDSELPTDEDTGLKERINSALALCLTAGPKYRFVVEKSLDFLLQVPTLKYLTFCVQRFLQSNSRIKQFEFGYEEEDYLHISKILASHFRNRWLCAKKKSDAKDGINSSKKGDTGLETIHEDSETSDLPSQGECDNSFVEWAHQRLPLPTHWFLSPISTISYDSKHMDISMDALEVAKAGLFFLLGIESVSSSLSKETSSPVLHVPLMWKLHSLSATLLIGMDVLEDERTRYFYECLQGSYGRLLDEKRLKGAEITDGDDLNTEFLRFKSEIHELYSSFIENLVEQYAATSFGDVLYGRQVAIYLHRCVEAPVRLAAWNELTNARVLELLPPLETCLAEPEGYLEPFEDDDTILEAYLRSWVIGALDRAAARGSVAYTLVLHHLSSFIFRRNTVDKQPLRNRFIKTLLRDYSQKHQHERMMIDLIQYNKESSVPNVERNRIGTEKRFEILTGGCDGNSSLVAQVEKLKQKCLL